MTLPSFYASSKAQCAIVGCCSATTKLIDLCERYAKTNAPVMLFGQPGCEFEKVAAFIHHCSDRATQPLIRQRCISWQDMADPIRLVGSGTLFVEGIQHASLPVQLRLLAELDENRLARYQSDGSVPTPPRIIVSACEDLCGLVEGGMFLEDLHWQLCGLSVEVPSLRQRSQDIPAIAQQMLDHGEVLGPGDQPSQISPSCYDLLREYDWPGNYRQLQSVLQRAVTLSASEQLIVTSEDLQHCAQHWPASEDEGYPASVCSTTVQSFEQSKDGVSINSTSLTCAEVSATGSLSLKGLDLNQLVQAVVERGIVEAERNHRESHSFIVDRIEKALIAAVLAQYDGVQKAAAQKLGINRNTLHKKIKDYGLE